MKMKQNIQFVLYSYKRILSILLFLVFPLIGFSQEVKVNTSVNSKKIIIGDHISYKNELTFDLQKFRVQLPRVNDTFNHFEVVERKKVDTNSKQNKFTITQETILTNFDSGVWVVPPNIFKVTPLDGSASYEIQSKPISIQVNTVEVDTSKAIMPIYEIIEADRSWWDAWKYHIMGFIGLLLLIAIVYITLKKLKNREKKPIKIKTKYVAPWDAATNSIQKLSAKELWLTNQEKQHHTRLTDIVRTYIEDAFEIDCFEKTSQEIITDVKKYLQKKKYKGRQEELEKLRTIFLTADLVKFAKSKPSEQEHVKSNKDALAFVQSTSVFLKNNLQSEPKLSER